MLFVFDLLQHLSSGINYCVEFIFQLLAHVNTVHLQMIVKGVLVGNRSVFVESSPDRIIDLFVGDLSSIGNCCVNVEGLG